MEVKRWSKGDDLETRCEFELNSGIQCSNRRVDGATRCPLHGANKQLEATENASLRVYRLSKFKQRASELTDHDNVKSLREEIAILRIIIEERINKCDDAHDLVIQSGPISDMIMKVEKVVSSCHRLEGQLGNLLDKQAVKNLAATLMQILAQKINEFGEANDIDPKIVGLLLESIANTFLEEIKA
jgi:hypothetical protein